MVRQTNNKSISKLVILDEWRKTEISAEYDARRRADVDAVLAVTSVQDGLAQGLAHTLQANLPPKIPSKRQYDEGSYANLPSDVNPDPS